MFFRTITDEIQLGILTVQNAQELFSLIDASRGYLRQWLPWVDGTKSPDDSREFIERSLHQFSSNNGFQAGIWYKAQIVGVIGFHAMDWNNRRTSIGYWLGEQFQGRGIMTTACRAMVDIAFREYKLNRVEIRAAVENTKSRAIPERLGFLKEGVCRQAEWLYDHFVDHVIYSMLSEDW
ncbi:GNAT family N-acetyltransferase [Alicyclobacillus macrosporangiidus]|uniref:Ribosomal-protein-serine acetyltransferase n=1 Tax=Alicyclobacillus macrosporangiidus TaxID=392015 RepID=A0A1I7KNT7_9BACL|nr:GNAT family protein [Alicyclobacillus macrosporangiidus]SFU99081.1 ribosomal-protein-serine acetyltransferase [Alicyclobacillus macrosporangiidus]